MNTKPLVSVIMPAYNHENYVQESIRSIIKQDYQNIELLIIDDGSKDLTWKKIQELKPECEKRFINVYFETKQNEGICITLNKLISLAKGDFVYIIASDDKAKPNAINRLLDFLEKNDDYVFCVGDNEIIDMNGARCFWNSQRENVYDSKEARFLTFCEFLKFVRREINFCSNDFGKYESFLRGNYIPNGGLIKKEAIDKIEKFTVKAPLEDYFLHLQLSKHGKYKFINQILFSYRWHNANTVKNVEKMRQYTDATFNYEAEILNKNKRYFQFKKIYNRYKKYGYYVYTKNNFILTKKVYIRHKTNKYIAYYYLFGLKIFKHKTRC